MPDDLRLKRGSGPKTSSTNYPVILCHIPAEQHPQFDSCESFWNTVQILSLLFGILIGLLLHGGLVGLPGNQAVKAADRVVDQQISNCQCLLGCRRWCTYTVYLIFLRKFTVGYEVYLTVLHADMAHIL